MWEWFCSEPPARRAEVRHYKQLAGLPAPWPALQCHPARTPQICTINDAQWVAWLLRLFTQEGRRRAGTCGWSLA